MKTNAVLLLVLLVRYHRVYNLLARSTEAVHPSGKQSPELRQSIFLLLEASAARPSTPIPPRASSGPPPTPAEETSAPRGAKGFPRRQKTRPARRRAWACSARRRT